MKTSWFNTQASGFGKLSLALVERKEDLCAGLKRNGDVKEVNGALPVTRRIHFTELICTAKHICPFHRQMDKQSHAETILNLPKGCASLVFIDLSVGLCVSEGVTQFDSI